MLAKAKLKLPRDIEKTFDWMSLVWILVQRRGVHKMNTTPSPNHLSSANKTLDSTQSNALSPCTKRTTSVVTVEGIAEQLVYFNSLLIQYNIKSMLMCLFYFTVVQMHR